MKKPNNTVRPGNRTKDPLLSSRACDHCQFGESVEQNSLHQCYLIQHIFLLYRKKALPTTVIYTERNDVKFFSRRCESVYSRQNFFMEMSCECHMEQFSGSRFKDIVR